MNEPAKEKQETGEEAGHEEEECADGAKDKKAILIRRVSCPAAGKTVSCLHAFSLSQAI